MNRPEQGQRVLISLPDSDVIGHYRGTRPDGTVVALVDDVIREFPDAVAVAWHPFTCSSCRGLCNRVFAAELVCADCFSKTAVRERVQDCDACGCPGAFRRPLGRRNEYFCAPCHVEKGFAFRQPSGVRA